MTATPDPFAGSEKNPSLAFATVGQSFTGIIAEAPTLVQGRDFESGELAFWPDGNPKMVVLITLVVDGEKRSLWAPKPSALFAALGGARPAGGFEVGGKLTVTYTGDKVNPDKPRLNPQKQYTVAYDGPVAADPFSTPGATPAPPVAPAVNTNGGMTPEKIAQLKAMGFDPAEVAASLGGNTPPF